MINLSPGTKLNSVKIGQEPRVFLSEVPPNPQRAIIFLKGSDQLEKSQKLFSRYLTESNVISIIPAALNRTGKIEWDIKNPQKDIDFLLNIKSQLPTGMRVCISGLSNGGVMALRAATAGHFDYLITFAASVYEGLNVNHKPSVLACHGKLDSSVPFFGGTRHGFTFLPAYDSILKFTSSPVTKTMRALPLTGELNTYTGGFTNKVQLLTVGDLAHNIVGYRGLIEGKTLIQYALNFFK